MLTIIQYGLVLQANGKLLLFERWWYSLYISFIPSYAIMNIILRLLSIDGISYSTRMLRIELDRKSPVAIIFKDVISDSTRDATDRKAESSALWILFNFLL